MKLVVVRCLILLCVISVQVKADQLQPFTSDGCSAFSDGTLEQNQLWLQCCVAHDYAYWKGGTYAERVQADKELKECVSRAGEDEIALLMLAGVRVGGTPLLPTSFRWGYGWGYPKFYGQLSEHELEQVRAMTESANIRGALGNI